MSKNDNPDDLALDSAHDVAGSPAPAADVAPPAHPALAELEKLLAEVERLIGTARMARIKAFAERIRATL